MPDVHKNFAISAVVTAPTPAASGTSLVVTTGQGTRFPTVPFNAVVCPAATDPDPSNAEVVRVTNISTDTLTITRAQESSSARTITVGDRIYAAVTAKTLTDAEAAVGAINVKAYGAKGDGTTNDSAAIQAAIDAAPQVSAQYGATIYFPPGNYKCNSALTLSGKYGIRLLGSSAASFLEGGAIGSVLVTGTASMTLVDFDGDGAGGLFHFGPIIEGLNFKDVAGGSTLLDFDEVNRVTLRNCAIRGGAVGVRFDGTSFDSAWHMLDQVAFVDNATGLLTTNCLGLTMTGGEFTDNTIGADIQSGSNIHFIGVKGDGGNPCFKSRGHRNTWTNCGWETTDSSGTYQAWDIDGVTGQSVLGEAHVLTGCIATGAGGANNKGFKIGSFAAGSVLIGCEANNMGTGFDYVDNGKYTTFLPANSAGQTAAYIEARDNAASIFKVVANSAGTKYTQAEFLQNGKLKLNDTAIICAGNNSPEGVVTATVGSIFMRGNGGTGTSMYVKESGSGNTGWVAK